MPSPSPCAYHDPEHGCILKSHKSPVCLAFLCRKAIDPLAPDGQDLPKRWRPGDLP